MIHKNREGIEWLEFELLSEFSNLSHGVLLRHGGFSTDSFGSLNLGFSLDNPIENEQVKMNRQKVQKVLGLNNFNDCKLEHGDTIIEITPHISECRPICDALSTKQLNISLFITHADCQAALFYDPKNRVIANVHAGWRGNVKNIYEKTVNHMREQYGSKPQNLLVCVSPSLGPQEAEFVHYRSELPEKFWKYQIKPHYFDLWNISKDQLTEAGVLEDHIQIAGISTLSNPKDFFSYRREKVSGRNATFITQLTP